MKHLEKFNESKSNIKLDYKKVERFLSTLHYSWGSEAPSEATWAANDFLRVLEDAYDYKFVNSFLEAFDEKYENYNYTAVLKEIENLLS